MIDIPVIELIPQREPMVMLSEIEGRHENGVTSVLHLTDENLFVDDNGFFTESGMLENIAQTAAAHVGLICKEKGLPVPVGFIGSMDNVELKGHASAGQSVTTTIDVLQEVFNVTLIQGVCELNGEVLLQCKMKIVINP